MSNSEILSAHVILTLSTGSIPQRGKLTLVSWLQGGNMQDDACVFSNRMQIGFVSPSLFIDIKHDPVIPSGWWFGLLTIY